MITLFKLVMNLLHIYSIIIIASVVFSWLFAFNVVNPRNQLVGSIGEFLYRVTEPVFRLFRQFLPNLGSLDIAPAIALIAVWLIKNLMMEYILPLL